MLQSSQRYTYVVTLIAYQILFYTTINIYFLWKETDVLTTNESDQFEPFDAPKAHPWLILLLTSDKYISFEPFEIISIWGAILVLLTQMWLMIILNTLYLEINKTIFFFLC